jgi:hypothetical protein
MLTQLAHQCSAMAGSTVEEWASSCKGLQRERDKLERELVAGFQRQQVRVFGCRQRMCVSVVRVYLVVVLNSAMK